MDSKDLEKMFDVIVSLEPTSPRPSRNDDLEEKVARKYSIAEIEKSSTASKFNKPPFSLNQVPPSIRRGSMDTRTSLFQNEISQPRANTRRTTLFRAMSKSLTKVSQEIDAFEIEDDELQNPNNLIRWDDGINVYEKVSHRNKVTEKDNTSSEAEKSSNDNRDTLTPINIDCRQSKDLQHRTSLEITNMKDLRRSNLSENACQNRSVEKRDTMRLQSAPQSARNSVLEQQLGSIGNQCSTDSGVDQTISIDFQSYLSNEVTNSLESFSDISESNVNALMEKEFSYLNSESPLADNWMSKSPKPTIELDVLVKGNALSQQKSKPTIKSEEEQNRFFRMMSNEMSLTSLATKEIIKFFMRNGTFSSQIIDKFQTAISVCNTLKKKFVIGEETSCQIIEVITKESLERPLEDHENILDIFYSWDDENYTNKFIFQENQSMYRIFKQPSTFTNEMKCDFEITDTMWVRGVNSKWIRVSCFITDGSVYFTTKQGSKDHKDLYSLVNLKKVDFYTCSNSKRIKKEYKSPTLDLIIFKENKSNQKPHEHAYIAAQSFQQKERWLEALKVAKYSFNQLKNNFLECQTCFPSGIRSQSSSQVRIEESSDHFEPCSV